MAVKLLDFSQALKKADGYGKRHLLLGNGFSIACKPDIFAYGVNRTGFAGGHLV